ncbi:mitofusin [Blastomyces gilchristii SLH14081]|uniref:Mitofusin n=1 Tax=Blastomyces gilchristii (strain SLH14081) TaxID=559298 RepID=A0A179V0V3_BLAGS|nr:mitofusin [Blastomyces gilchristii SLH14081]OAT13048.1 mitofusin [Blastomyces gilchristii SLH14081]
MSQQYFPSEAGSAAGEGSSKHATGGESSNSSHHHGEGPEYMVVGSGSVSHNVTSLMASLNHDSGYGGSIMGESADGLMGDRPTPSHTPVVPGQLNEAAEHERQIVASHVHQLLYNSNRTQLSRSITRTVELLKELQQMNRKWPAHYPPVQSTQPTSSYPPGPQRVQSWQVDAANSNPFERPDPLRRTTAGVDGSAIPDSSEAAENRPPPGPRLVTPQIAQEFSILKLDLKLGALSQSELVHSLEKGSIASLLDGRVSQSIRHLLSLRDRIEDLSSKVLITGDLNAGKSTFCNALLRRKVLPEDQQPCTSIFCEVLDARENGGVEEVHAIHKDRPYNRNDESTYDVYSIQDLESIVVDNSKYMQCKIYLKDVRTIDESLLNNGVVDISIIDAPGLNSDSVKTTAVFARQEEIDVVVFVVSAANHFTLSAQEFIMNAAHEKAYIFIVVNGFDNIRDKQRCQQMVLKQIAKLSPRTFKESAELVHFVSSNAVPVMPAITAGGGGGGGDGDGGDNGLDLDDEDGSKGKGKAPIAADDKGKGKEKEKIQDFENLEGALRRFVLDKRSRSKLAPAKTYLLNILSDLHVLASANRDVASSELDRMTKELEELVPAYEESMKSRTEVTEQLSNSIDESCEEVYNHSRTTLSTRVATLGEATLGVEYPGLFSAFQYAEDLKVAMLDELAATVSACEDYARGKSVQGVNMIQSIGLLHVGEDKFPNLNFRADLMFKQKRHITARQIDTEIDIWDFFDIAGLWHRQEKVAGTSMAMTLVTVLGGRALGGSNWIDGALGAARILGTNNMRRMIVPGMVAAALLTASYLLTQIPTALPTNISRKLSESLAEIDYIHTNATRISSEVRRVLRMPASRLQSTLQTATEELAKRKAEVGKTKEESEVASKYFSNLFRESRDTRRAVEQVDLESPLPGSMAQYQQQAARGSRS